MYLKEKTWQHRRDFRGILQCEHCGQQQELTSGYDDVNYHENVIPSIKCRQCGQVAPADGKRTAPSVPAWKVI